MKKRWLPVMIIVLAVSLVSGCGQLLVAIGGAQAVLAQAEGALEDETGIIYKGEGKNIISDGSGTGMSFEMDLEGKYSFTFDPYAVHIDGQVKAGNESLQVESYVVGNEAYDLIEEDQWQKNTIDEKDFIHKYDPRVTLRFLSEADDHTKMEEKEGEYILQAELSGNQVKELMKEYHQETLDDIKENLEDIATVDELKLNNITYKVWIDSDTFLPKKYELNQEVEAEMEGDKVEVKLEITFSHQGKVEKITIPDEAKKNAQ